MVSDSTLSGKRFFGKLPTASAFIIALKHQPHIFFASYPVCAYTQQGVKQSGLSVVNTKIARSDDLGMWVTRKHRESVGIIE